MELADAARRVILMVGELHRLGYGRLRLCPGMSASGCHWQAFITAASNVPARHGAMAAVRNVLDAAVVAAYQTGMRDRYFGWEDAAGDGPAELAAKFVARFPQVAESGRGDDPAYAAWYREMVAATEPGGLVYAHSDWGDYSPDHLNVNGASAAKTVPYPPPGELVLRKPT